LPERRILLRPTAKQHFRNATLTNRSPSPFWSIGPYAVPVSRLITAIVTFAVLLATAAEHRTPVRHNETLDVAVSVNHIAVIGDSYTTGGDLGGLGSNGWTAKAWQLLTQKGIPVSADVAAEGGAGYGTRGNHGSVFEDLTARAVKPDDVLVVFFGSRNDQGVDPTQLSVLAWGTFQLARSTAPKARFLVIGPPWPTADPPEAVLRIRDSLKYQAGVAGATFIDPIAAGWFVGRPDLIGKDGVHPTDAGHAYMADKIAPLIGAQLA
jgi:lysophospholipase L1-like esterase